MFLGNNFGYQLEIEYYVSTFLSKDICFVRSSECTAPCLVKEFAFGVFGGAYIKFPHNSCDRGDRNCGLRGAEVLECCVTYK
jgi:hypothetical protein